METVVKLDNFTGPLDLLLFLVKENEVDVHDIPIARIAEQYLEIISTAQRLDVEVAGEFLLMAATLAELKSRRLIPAAAPVEDDELAADAADPRIDLIRQLLRFRHYKERAGWLERAMIQRELAAARPHNAANHLLPAAAETEPLVDADAYMLAVVHNRLKEQIGAFASQPLVYDDIPVEQKIEEILAALADRSRVLFDDIIANPSDSIEVVTTLIAVLELVKQRLAVVRQLEGLPAIVIMRPAEAPPVGVEAPAAPAPPLPGAIAIAGADRRDELADTIAEAMRAAGAAVRRAIELRKRLSAAEPEPTATGRHEHPAPTRPPEAGDQLAGMEPPDTS